MWPQYLRNRYFKYFLGITLMGLCLSFSSFNKVFAAPSPQNLTLPLQNKVPQNFPGLLETFEKLIQVDEKKMSLLGQKDNETIRLIDLLNQLQKDKKFRAHRSYLDADFINSLILHSSASYLTLASQSKCQLYEALLTDLISSSSKKMQEIPIIFRLDDDSDLNHKTIKGFLTKKQFLNLILPHECPESLKNIEKFQVKNLAQTLKETPFISPQNKMSCVKLHQAWLKNSKLPYLCQIHEFIKNESIETNFSSQELKQKKILRTFLKNKLGSNQRYYLKDLCENLHQPSKFCAPFFNTSYWNKVRKNPLLFSKVSKLCRDNDCLQKLEEQPETCHYSRDSFSGIKPWPDCQQLSQALLHSNQNTIYDDCPGHSDQLIITNISRILFHFSSSLEELKALPVNAPERCLFTSAQKMFHFNDRFDNDENWKLEACYEDKINEVQVCKKIYFSQDTNDDHSYSKVVSSILTQTRGVDPNLKCMMITKDIYNPATLKYKSGCFIVYDKNSCHSAHCPHQIYLNDKKITHIKLKYGLPMNYFPTTIAHERYAQNSILTKDLKQSGMIIKRLSQMISFFKNNPNGIIHGIGCAEDLLPSFFPRRVMHQCNRLPFIVSGFLNKSSQDQEFSQKKAQKNYEEIIFVTRTAVDDMQAPRLISWSSLLSSLKNYQLQDPLKTWALIGLKKKK